ncbi:MAG: tRNA 2-thiouridine(34) synthase MnmA [Lachnospiraceae bacterium]|nr:tRNA 2-thiouridine(34) synthase MnmA [Lachnospiraceae bacterium]
MEKALIAMSGGVDSSVAAVLMKEKGYAPIGITMKLYDNEDIYINKEKTCCSLSDIDDARAVALKADFPYYVLNFKAQFKEKVIDKFVSCYMCGSTPNPCIDCNRYLKFDELYRRAKELECEYIVTGHYARVRFDAATGKYQLLKGVDDRKDQSYVLYHLTQEQLAHTIFPLGEYTKDEIRSKAEEYGLHNANKRDSQDICFIPDGDYINFIEEFNNEKIGSGNILDINGKVVGRHKGYYKYTLGQRKGVNVSRTGKNYVLEINADTNEIVIGRNKDLFKTTLIADSFNWISGESPKAPVKVQARTRYHQALADATAEVLDDGRVKVIFDEPQRAITKGQSAVLYDGDVVLGGGEIVEVTQ